MFTKLNIIEEFNHSVDHLRFAFEAARQEDLARAQDELENASYAIYRALEWTIKNTLHKIYPNSVADADKIKIIEAPNFRNKLELFKSSVTPSPSSIGVDLAIITELKPSVRNNPEHSGYAPHFNSLVKVIHESRKLILNYIAADAKLRQMPEIKEAVLDEDVEWNEFYNLCNRFEAGRNYILVIGSAKGYRNEKLKSLGLIDWSLIFDFDPETLINGFHKNAEPVISNRRKVHIVTAEDSFSFSQFYSTYWIAANGLTGRASTLSSNPKDWNRKVTPFFNRVVREYFLSFGDKPTTVVCLYDDSYHSNKICEVIYNSAGDSAAFVYAVPDPKKLATVQDVYPGSEISISIPKISTGIFRIRSYFNSSTDKDLVTLPSKDEEYIEIQKSDLFWIEENLELVYKNIEETFIYEEDHEKEREYFYKGGLISWKGLHFHYDVDRDKTLAIKRKVEKSLKDRVPNLINIYHYPGIGGTTISRRVSWDLHREYPVMVLKKYLQRETVNRIYKVFELTKKSPLIVAESSVVNLDDIDRLLNEIKSRTFPATILVTQRYDKVTSQPFYISDFLSDVEYGTFLSEYKRLAPKKKGDLERMERSPEKQERHPFFLGLTAFEESFTGLQKFVEKNLSNATSMQKQALAVISIAYYYSQRSISSQLLSGVFMTHENSIVRLDKHLNSDLLYLIISDYENKWRPIHYLVAKELIEQILAPGNRALWKHNLPDLCIQIIHLVANQSSIPSEEEMELLRRLFVYRDNQEILGRDDDSMFSNLIEAGFQSDEARLRVFKQLTESFPSESHFWAHLARFYSLKMQNYDEALKAINKAIEASTAEDSLLYHMKGMCLRSKARHLMSQRVGLDPDQIRLIDELVEESGENFEQCRIINPSNEHGFISHVQLLINYIDFRFLISKNDSKQLFLRNLNAGLRDKLDLAEELLDQVKLQSQMKTENTYIGKCDLALQEMYENFSSVIEGWNNLLATSNISKPPVRRQIVRAYVRRASAWDKISKSEAEKIIRLIEDNINEEPSKGTNIFLWFQAARQLNTIEINSAIDKVSNWRTISDSPEATYYLAVLHCLQAINGTSASRYKAEQLIKQLSELNRYSPYRTHCYEWMGKNAGLGQIIPYKIATKRADDSDLEFETDLLKRVDGLIANIRGPESGEIELPCGLKAFFIPARGEGFARDRDLNRKVDFFLGFSNDGLRAYDVIGSKI